MTFDPMQAIIEANRVWPEPLSLPESLEDATELELAEARSLLIQVTQVATALRKVIDQELAGALQGSVMEYGGMVIRPNNGRGSATVADPEAWWEFVADVMNHLDSPGRASLMAAMYPASAVRLTALEKLGQAVDIPGQAIKDTFIIYDTPTSPLSVMPKDRAPKFLQDLEEGEVRKVT